MAQFDVYRNPNRDSRAPYLLDLQHGMFSQLRTRIVAPLIPAEQVKPMTRINPVFEVEGRQLVMSTTELAGIAIKDIGAKVESLAQERDRIIAALDYVFTGV